MASLFILLNNSWSLLLDTYGFCLHCFVSSTVLLTAASKRISLGVLNTDKVPLLVKALILGPLTVFRFCLLLNICICYMLEILFFAIFNVRMKNLNVNLKICKGILNFSKLF
jgi:hypothetical protein